MRPLRHLLSQALLLLALWMTVFHMWLSALALLVFAWLLRGPPRRRPLLWMAFLLGLPLSWLPVYELGARLEQLRLAEEAEGAEAFSTRDLIGVSGLNLLMAGGGLLVGFPEVALETTLLMSPLGLPHGELWMRSDFAMGSAKVRRALADLGSTPLGSSRTVTLSWSASELTSAAEARVALALACPLRLTAERLGPRRLRLTGSCRVAYPRRNHLLLARDPWGQPIGLDEGLFWVLQQRGWMRPYTAHWVWEIDDQG